MVMTPGHQLLRGREGLKTGEKAIPEVCFTKLDYEPGQFKSCRTLTLDESPHFIQKILPLVSLKKLQIYSTNSAEVK